jgi:hypothetical protein
MHHPDANRAVGMMSHDLPVIASEATQSILPFRGTMDCFVALLLAMTTALFEM